MIKVSVNSISPCLPSQVEPCLMVVPQGRAVVLLRRFYRSLPSATGPHLAPTARAVVPQQDAVVPHLAG